LEVPTSTSLSLVVGQTLPGYAKKPRALESFRDIAEAAPCHDQHFGQDVFGPSAAIAVVATLEVAEHCSRVSPGQRLKLLVLGHGWPCSFLTEKCSFQG